MSSVAVVPRERRAVVAPPRPLPDPWRVLATLIMLGLLIAAIWSIAELRINIASLIDSSANAQRFVQRMFPLDFPKPAETAALLGQTLSIVFLATLLSVVISIPVAILAAWNTTPGAGWQVLSRFLIVLARAIPDLVLAIVFFRIFGLGGLPGILAMGLHSVGMVGKLYADSLESIPQGAELALRANGASRWQRVLAGYVPQWAPQLLSIGLYRFDINLRTSVLLGYVGVGGIGLALANSLRALQYRRGMALAVLILIVCVAVELLSGWLRTAIHGRGAGTSPWSWVTRPARRPAVAPASTERRLTPPWTAGRVGRALAMFVVLALIVASCWGSNVDPMAAGAALTRLPQTVGYFFPPEVAAILPDVLSGLLVTVEIALASTLLGAVLAIPMGVLAARNVFPNRGLNTFFRVLIVCIRAVPDVILAIIMVVITGLGGVAGTLALAIGSVGMLGKLVADSLEETDQGVQEALRANGASRGQVFWTATIRQVLPALVSNLLYVLDSHIRAATLLGVVGAGGVGFLLLNAARVMEYRAITTIIIAILLVVLVVEGLSMIVRKALR